MSPLGKRRRRWGGTRRNRRRSERQNRTEQQAEVQPPALRAKRDPVGGRKLIWHRHGGPMRLKWLKGASMGRGSGREKGAYCDCGGEEKEYRAMTAMEETR